MIEVTALNTLFMFLTASSFAFATVGSIKKSLIDFFEVKIGKLIKDDTKRQKKIFGILLGDASLDYTDADKKADDKIKKERNQLQEVLTKHKNNAKKFAENKLTRILKKYRLISFAIGLQSFFFIFLSGLYGADIIKGYATLYSFTILSSLFILYMFGKYKFTPKRDVLKNFKIGAMLITSSLFFSLLIKDYSLNSILSILIKDYSATSEYLVIFSFWILIQFLLFTVILPLNAMDKRIKNIQYVYDKKRNLIWDNCDSVEKAKEDSTQNQSNIFGSNRNRLSRMADKYS